MRTEVELEEFEPGRWRVKKSPQKPARSDLPTPNVISDCMPPTEQVNGVYYTSKRKFREVGKSLGLVEVGTEKLPAKPKGQSSMTPAAKAGRREALQKALAKVRT